MPRQVFLLLWVIAGVGTLVLVAKSSPGAERRPNVLVIVADDLGYADLGVQGCPDIPTPRIDSIARNGVRLTDGYVSCPVCSPTRAGLMTGRYQQRFGHEFNPGNAESADPNFGLPLTEVTLADRLHALGYATGAIGKWHLGYRADWHPAKRGFDEFFGFSGGNHSYTQDRDPTNRLLRGTEPVTTVTYTTDMFGDEAVAFIERHREQPWLLYLAFNAVHTPLEPPPGQGEAFATITDEKRRKMAAMLTSMDANVGKVLDQLQKSGTFDNTLVFFVSDNGGPTPANGACNDPLDGNKGEVKEGGIRVPFFVQWPDRLPAGTTRNAPVIALDILPTAVAAAGGTIAPESKLDGVNLLPYLRGDEVRPPHDRLFWRTGDRWAVRMGDWKLRHNDAGETPRLYNLASDIAEQRDLASAEPEQAARLQAAWSAWNAELETPRWVTSRTKPGKARTPKKARPTPKS